MAWVGKMENIRKPSRGDCAAGTDLQIRGKGNAVGGYVSREFYPSETVVPRNPAYRALQKASNDLLETLKARLKGEVLPAGGAAAGAGLERPMHGVRVPLPLRLLRRAAARAGSPAGATVQEAAMRVVRFFLEAAGDPDLAGIAGHPVGADLRGQPLRVDLPSALRHHLRHGHSLRSDGTLPLAGGRQPV